jgi:hypothetical protein
MYNMVMYYYVLIVFLLHRGSLKLILATDPFRGGSVTLSVTLFRMFHVLRLSRKGSDLIGVNYF